MINKLYFDKKTNKKIRLLQVINNYGYGVTDDGLIIKVNLEDLDETSDSTKMLDDNYFNKIIQNLIEIQKLQNLINDEEEKIIYSIDDKKMIKR